MLPLASGILFAESVLVYSTRRGRQYCLQAGTVAIRCHGHGLEYFGYRFRYPPGINAPGASNKDGDQVPDSLGGS